MKKLMFALIAVTLTVPALAQDKNAPQPAGKDTPAVEMQRDHEAFKKAHEEHRAKMEATNKKMGKLVEEYNKLKAGKKKDAKRAEIEKEVDAIHQEQLKFKQEQLGKFEERLARMKAGFEKESSAEGQKAWVTQKTDELIKANGDLKALFEPDRGPHMGNFPGRAPHMGKGPRGLRPDGKPAPRD